MNLNRRQKMRKETEIERAKRIIAFCIDWMRYENEQRNHVSYQKAKQELAYWEGELGFYERTAQYINYKY